MDLSMEATGGGSGDEQENRGSGKGKKTYHRHTSDQTAKLESIFSECPHPDDSQRRQIAKELGLEPKQVKFWFQNKRTQKKTQAERADNNALRVENERIQKENLLIKEALKSIICPSCGGPPCGDEDHDHSLKQLRLENARLKAERENVSKLLAKYLEKPMSEATLDVAPSTGPSSNDVACVNNLGGSASLSFPNEGIVSNAASNRAKTEKAIMLQTAVAAKEELLKLLCTNEPLWLKSSSERRFVLHSESYESIFPKLNHFQNCTGRVESSKDSRIVRIKAIDLVDMFLDSKKWTGLFSTIVTKADTVEVIEHGSPETRNGALLLMYEEMHVLSPLVQSREFYFLRYCEQVEASIWLIADVSLDFVKDQESPYLGSWRFPSGCLIHEISTGSSQVSWVEHVEVDERIQAHRLYRDFVNGSIAYGAERWLMELQRMCERFNSAAAEYIPSYDTGGVITIPEGRRSIMKLCHGMVKSFCGILNMSNKMDFPQHLAEDNSGIRISVRKNTDPRQSNASVIITAATSFWLPLPSQSLFDFFKDPIGRVKWDALCFGNPVHEMARISTGTHPSNYISIIRPLNPSPNNNVLIIQESFIDHLGSYVVYSPVNVPDLKKVIDGEDSSMVWVLPSGIVISEDEQAIADARASSCGEHNGEKRTRGSLLTLAFQILMCSPASMNLESVASVNSLITATVQNINDALLSGSNHLEFQ